MTTKFLRILTILYAAVSSLVTLIILVNAFDSSGKKYVPAMIIANKFAFPILISALALFFLVFFEPEAMNKKSVITIFKILFLFTLIVFGYYTVQQFTHAVSFVALGIFCVEEILLMLVTVLFFQIKTRDF